MLFVRPASEQWTRQFAWLPTQLNDSQTIWLEFYEWRYSPAKQGFEMRRHMRQRPTRQFDIRTAIGVLTAAGIIVDPPSQFETTYRVQHDKFDTTTEPMAESDVIILAKQVESNALKQKRPSAPGEPVCFGR